MAGIYIHIPFCVQRCYYCDFYSTIKLQHIDDYVEALIKEIQLKSDFFQDSKIETIYFGGGTPSVLNINKIEKIKSVLYKTFKISNNPEITIEINPDDTNPIYLNNLLNIDINRLSIGVQSFDDTCLKLMNRRHNSKQAIKSIENAIKMGFKNISIDLIYGLPGMTLEKWIKELELAFSLQIRHLSAYHLTYEKKTVFKIWLIAGKIKSINDEESWQQFFHLNNEAKKNDFEHYEISNLAKKDFYSRHNSGYWNDKKYLGLGPSAHSYNGHSRQWNVSNLKNYIQAINDKKVFFETEELSIKNKINEYILTKLRTSAGLNLSLLKDSYGIKYFKYIRDKLNKYTNSEHALIKENQANLTLKGWFISDKIISDLLIV